MPPKERHWARTEGKVVFIAGAVPGDVVDVQLSKNKKDWAEGKAVHFHTYSKDRVEPFCEHFGVCGGCKWQMLPYEKQLQYKQNEVAQNLRSLGKIDTAGNNAHYWLRYHCTIPEQTWNLLSATAGICCHQKWARQRRIFKTTHLVFMCQGCLIR